MIWRPHLRKDVLVLEKIQRRATKFILNDYSSDYKQRLISLHLLPLSMVMELNDVIFLHTPLSAFNILDSSRTTRSSTSYKLSHSYSFSTLSSHFYFARLPCVWNSLPSIDPLNLISNHSHASL